MFEYTLLSDKCYSSYTLLIQASDFCGDLLLNVGVNRHVAKIHSNAMCSSKSYYVNITKRCNDASFHGRVLKYDACGRNCQVEHKKTLALFPRIAFLCSV